MSNCNPIFQIKMFSEQYLNVINCINALKCHYCDVSREIRYTCKNKVTCKWSFSFPSQTNHILSSDWGIISWTIRLYSSSETETFLGNLITINSTWTILCIRYNSSSSIFAEEWYPLFWVFFSRSSHSINVVFVHFVCYICIIDPFMSLVKSTIQSIHLFNFM